MKTWYYRFISLNLLTKGQTQVSHSSDQESLITSFRKNIPLFQALGDPVRQDIIQILIKNGTLNVNRITALTNISRPAISHHLKILKDAKIVEMRKEGNQNMYTLQATETLQNLKTLIKIVEKECGISR
ncbi:MAG: winged helix-turn-helix transcriptional regulator [Bacillales bacterium]|nr:winged helix-turn-helix transcriptional regulator [Bacillales bacterium]